MISSMWVKTTNTNPIVAKVTAAHSLTYLTLWSQQRYNVNTVSLGGRRGGGNDEINHDYDNNGEGSVCVFHVYACLCVCIWLPKHNVCVCMFPETTAEVGTIAGIVSAVAMALVGAVSSYISYQKKKFCFSIQRKSLLYLNITELTVCVGRSLCNFKTYLLKHFSDICPDLSLLWSMWRSWLCLSFHREPEHWHGEGWESWSCGGYRTSRYTRTPLLHNTHTS